MYIGHGTHFGIGSLCSAKRIGLLLCAGAVILAVVFYLNTQGSGIRDHAVRFLEWLDRLGHWAPVLFVLVDMAVVILILPGVVLTLGAGFIFGVVMGTIYVVIATTLGATATFLIARYLFHEWVAGFLLNHKKMKQLDSALSQGGWKIVLLTRLVPFFPFKLSNYFFGLMRISLRDFVLGVFFGIIPITVHNVYIGSAAAELATIAAPAYQRSPAQWAIYGIGFVAVVTAAVYLRRLARRTLAAYMSEHPHPQDNTDPHDLPAKDPPVALRGYEEATVLKKHT